MYVFAVLTLGALATASLPESSAHTDAAEPTIDGTWETVAYFADGQFVRDAIGGREVISGNVVENHVILRDARGNTTCKVRIRLDPSQTPKAADLEVTQFLDGAQVGEPTRYPGIYELVGGTFVVCTAEPGEPRPKKFEIKPGYQLVVYKRVETENTGK
jgi:uncharacterized protein (TIGR03067 family)